MSRVWSVTSWSMSRSPVTIVVSRPRLSASTDDRADDVVRLVARQLVDRDAQRLDHLADLRELVAQVVRHPLAGGLVLGVLLVAEGRALEVEGDRDVVGLEVLDAAQDDAAEAEDGVDELALRRRQRREREVSAVDQPVAVEQHQAFVGHGSSVAACPADFEGRAPVSRRRSAARTSAGAKRPSPAMRNATDSTTSGRDTAVVLGDEEVAGPSGPATCPVRRRPGPSTSRWSTPLASGGGVAPATTPGPRCGRRSSGSTAAGDVARKPEQRPMRPLGRRRCARVSSVPSPWLDLGAAGRRHRGRGRRAGRRPALTRDGRQRRHEKARQTERRQTDRERPAERIARRPEDRREPTPAARAQPSGVARSSACSRVGRGRRGHRPGRGPEREEVGVEVGALAARGDQRLGSCALAGRQRVVGQRGDEHRVVRGVGGSGMDLS